MRSLRCSLGSCLLASLLGGCPTPADPDAGLDVPPIDASVDARVAEDVPVAPGDLRRDFCAPLAAVICASADACGCGVVLPGGELDVPACVTRWTERCLASWQPFVDGGAVIDGAAASACVAAVSSATPACARPDGTVIFGTCAPFAVQPVALGEPCTTPYCADGTGVCVGGTCTARGAAGAACADMFSCATGLVCSDGTCATPLGEGGACDTDLDCRSPLRCGASGCALRGDIGAACVEAAECAIGLVCEKGSCSEQPPSCTASAECGAGSTCGGARTCEPRLGSGSPCEDDRECAADAYCDGVCTARPGEGEACVRGVVCGAGLGCDTEGGTCIALPEDGAACAFGEMGPVCAEGFACIDGSTCGPLPGEGEPCAGANLCAAGLGCDFTPSGSVCIVPRGEGGACESDRSCAAAFHCGSEGTCAADLSAGSPCSVGNECAGVCGPDAAGGFSCRDLPEEGDPCLFSDECPSATACLASSRVCLPEICGEL